MNSLFSALPRISHLVFCEPWMILPEFHQRTMVPQLLAAREGQMDFRGYRDADNRSPAERAREEHAKRDEQLCAAAAADSFRIKPEEKRAKIPYNIDSDGVAQILVKGIIGKGLDDFDMSCGGVCVDHLTAALDHLAEYKPRAVAMHFDTPGGTVTGVPEAAAAVRSFASSVAPVHGYTDTMSASAGYRLMAECSTVAVSGSAVIGSIGVYCALVDSSRMYQEMGVDVTLIASGKYKGQGTLGVPLSADYIEQRRAQCMEYFRQFAGAVTAARADEIATEAAALSAASGNPVAPEEHAFAIMQGQSWPAGMAPRALWDAQFPDRRAHVRAVRGRKMGK